MSKGAPVVINHTILLQKLIAIERAIGTASNKTIRDMVYDAENHLLQMQREEVQGLPLSPKEETAERFEFMREVVAGGVSKASF